MVRVGSAARALGMLVGGLGLLGLLGVTIGAVLGVERFPSPLGQGRVDYASCAAQLALLTAAAGGIAAIGRRVLQRRSGADAHVALARVIDTAARPHRAAREPVPASSVTTPGRTSRPRPGLRRRRRARAG